MQANTNIQSVYWPVAEPLQLAHKTELERLLETLGDGLSEYCFSNLFLFRELHDYKFLGREYPCITGNTYDRCSYLMPLFDISEIGHERLKKMCKGMDFIYPISEQQVSRLDKTRFNIYYNNDDSDYIYSANKLKYYKGSLLSKKRNLMKQFLKTSSPNYQLLSVEHIQDALAVLNQWQMDKEKSLNETDYFPCCEAIKLIKNLNLEGLIYYVEKEPAGFIIGEEVSYDIFVIHFAKGKDKYKGIFQYMFNHFANYIGDRVNYYNFEQDLGNLKLRKTKRSYCPDKLLHKYRVCPL